MDNDNKQIVNSKLLLISHYKDDARSKIVIDSFKDIIYHGFSEFMLKLRIFTDYFSNLYVNYLLALESNPDLSRNS